MNYTVLIVIAVVAIVAISLIVSSYQTASPDEVKVVTGLGNQTKYVSGGSVIIIPFFQKVDKLSLKLIDVNVDTAGFVPTKDFINLKLDGNATCQIRNTPEDLELAKTKFLNLSVGQIEEMIVKTLEANTREIIGTMTLKDISQNKEQFSTKVQEITQTELGRLGIEVLNFNIQSFDDEQGVIKDLGIENIEQIKKDARIAKSNAERETSITVSNNKELSEKARIDQELKTKALETEANIKKAEMDRKVNIENARTDMSYQTEQERIRKNLEEEIANANIMKAEKGAEVEAKKAIEYKNLLEGTKNADAESKKFEEMQIADAEAYRIKSIAEAMSVETKAIKERGLVEAQVVKAKAEAENTINESALALAVINALPEMAKSIAESMQGVDSINLYGSGAVEEYHGTLAMGLSASMNTMKTATGIDVADLLTSAVKGNVLGGAIGRTLTPEDIDVSVD